MGTGGDDLVNGGDGMACADFAGVFFIVTEVAIFEEAVFVVAGDGDGGGFDADVLGGDGEHFGDGAFQVAGDDGHD